MIIHDFDVMHIASLPFKADTPLVVNPNIVLIQAVISQFFQAIGRGGTRRSSSWSVPGFLWEQENVYATGVGGGLAKEAEWEKACLGVDGQTYA